MKRIAKLLFSCLALLTAGCDVPIDLDLDQTQPVVSIEALLTDRPGKQYVRLTLSTDFYSQSRPQSISNAIVTLKDDHGESVSFIHYQGTDTDSAGMYFPPAGYAGKVGRTYTITIQAQGSVYEATDKLLRVTSIDSLAYRPNIYAVQDPPPDGKTYELLVYAKEPQNTKDYYMVKYYRNDSLTYRGDTDVYVLDDYGIGEDINGIPSSVLFAISDKAGLEMYSLSRDGFLFYNDLVTIMNSDGGMFSPPPANPRTNFNGRVLGFFQVSAVSSREVVLHE
jgi:hypothetical protein